MTVQEHSGSRAPLSQAKPVEVYDFRRPSSLVREHSRALELAFETFARQWGTQLTAKVRVISQVVSDSVQMLKYDEYAASLPLETAMVLCAIDGSAPDAVIQFPMGAALTWVGHMVGSAGEIKIPERKFSLIEQALVRSMMDDALEDLAYSLGGLLRARIVVDSIQYNSQFAQAAATTELMIVATFTIRVGNSASPATLAIPANVLLPQLSPANTSNKTTHAQDLVLAQVERTPVEVTVQFAPAKIRPGIVLGLAVGDLLPLPHPSHRPLDVAVDGRPIAHGAVGSNGSRLAVVVTTEETL